MAPVEWVEMTDEIRALVLQEVGAIGMVRLMHGGAQIEAFTDGLHFWINTTTADGRAQSQGIGFFGGLELPPQPENCKL
jgi:hypothetical protein